MTIAAFARKSTLILVLLLVSGCVSLGPKFYVDVSALKDARIPERRTYVIFPGQDGVAPNDLQFREFAATLERVLRAKGFSASEPQARPDLVVLLSYGIGEPRTTYYSYPIFGQLAGGTSTVSATTLGSNGTTSYTTGTVTTPARTGVVGTGTRARVEYGRWATVEAIDVDAYVRTQKFVPVWRTTMTSTGSSGDLRLVFPVMLAAGQPYIGGNTRQQVHRVLKSDSPDVVAIR